MGPSPPADEAWAPSARPMRVHPVLGHGKDLEGILHPLQADQTQAVQRDNPRFVPAIVI